MATSDSSRRRSWPIDVMGSKYLAVRAEDLKPNENPLPVPLALKAIEKAVIAPNDPRQLTELARALAPGGRGLGTVNLRLLLRAFESGKLALLIRRVSNTLMDMPASESVAEQLKATREVKTWVAMEVVDMEGNPVPNKSYLCMLPNGTVQEGVLDRTGKVRFDGIDPGNCVFVLTELDQDAWERVS
ncbi:MAG: hypothetical protein ACKV2U_25870 [Bryobacteraceae bacterium]